MSFQGNLCKKFAWWLSGKNVVDKINAQGYSHRDPESIKKRHESHWVSSGFSQNCSRRGMGEKKISELPAVFISPDLYFCTMELQGKLWLGTPFLGSLSGGALLRSTKVHS